MSLAVTAAVVTGIAAVGSAYSQIQAGKEQQKMANVQNARERKQALREMRMRMRMQEAQGVASNTYGGTGMVGAMASAQSSTAGAIGFQSSLLQGAQQVSHWNNMASGFGALGSVGQAMGANAGSIMAAVNKNKGTA